MATHAYIIESEQKIIDRTITRDEIIDLIEAFYYECSIMGGKPYPENRDCWGTLYVNAKVSGDHRLSLLVDVLRREFD